MPTKQVYAKAKTFYHRDCKYRVWRCEGFWMCHLDEFWGREFSCADREHAIEVGRLRIDEELDAGEGENDGK